jgi:hypothetical protein
VRKQNKVAFHVSIACYSVLLYWCWFKLKWMNNTPSDRGGKHSVTGISLKTSPEIWWNMVNSRLISLYNNLLDKLDHNADELKRKIHKYTWYSNSGPSAMQQYPLIFRVDQSHFSDLWYNCNFKLEEEEKEAEVTSVPAVLSLNAMGIFLFFLPKTAPPGS